MKLTGKSGQKHQIDVYWEYQYDNTTFKIVIECKNYNHTVSIGKVRDFFGVLYDLENVKGIMVTKKGYQEGAKKFGAHYGIDLMELREPEEGEAIVAETTLTIDSSIRHRLFLIDEPKYTMPSGLHFGRCPSVHTERGTIPLLTALSQPVPKITLLPLSGCKLLSTLRQRP